MIIFIIIIIIIILAICFVWYITKENPMVTEVRKRLRLLEPNLKFNVYENTLTDSTFTLSKTNIYLCTKTKDINTLTYVGIHELAHIKTHTYGHDKDFIKNFRELLNKANQMGLWQPVNYSENPQKYCGIMVKDNVY